VVLSSAALTVKELMTTAKAVPNADLVEEDYRVSIQRTPNDTRYNELWGMVKISAPQAWDKTIGTRSVVVGVIDTGIDYIHPELKANLWRNQAELYGTPGIDDDNNGYIDDVYGIDAYNDDADPALRNN
jgi:subtilisin family serine protease